MERIGACAGSLPLNVLPIYYILRCNSATQSSTLPTGRRVVSIRLNTYCSSFGSVVAVSIEEMHGKILFELLVQRLYSPTKTVYLRNLFYRKVKIVGQQHNRFLVFAKEFNSSGP